jgi:predicted RNase H-like nuclease (RuvC/YqgF family)
MAEQETGELTLTYAELATRLGVSADGARTRAKRAGWPVIAGNDGRARVRVLASNLPERPPEQTASTTDHTVELRRAYAERVTELKGELEEARGQVERWRSATEQTRAEVERERAVNGLLREQLERELARVGRLEEELRAMLAEARRPWWRRLFR